MIALLFLLPFFQRVVFGRRGSGWVMDMWMMRVGLGMEVVGFALYAIAKAPGWFYGGMLK